jgi:hypothetical protein
MPSTCFWCNSRSSVELRAQNSCVEPPPAQAGPGARRRGIYVCPAPECQAKMLPRVNQEIIEDWCRFHFTRKMVTNLRKGGATAVAAFATLERVPNPSLDQRIVRGLRQSYNAKSGRKIYDPEFDDPAFHAGASALELSRSDAGMFWFFIWIMLMRFNRSLNNKLHELWHASGQDLKIMVDSMSDDCFGSITSRANEDDASVKDRIVELRMHFKSGSGSANNRRYLDMLLTGSKSFQEVLKEFPLPGDLRPKYFGTEENEFASVRRSFKAYFVGKVCSASFPTCVTGDLVGPSLLAANAKDRDTALQLFDLLSDGELPTGMLSQTESGLAKRAAWATWAYGHFNEVRSRFGLPEIERGRIEHSGCEFIRYIREMIDKHWLEEIPAATRTRIPPQFMSSKRRRTSP